MIDEKKIGELFLIYQKEARGDLVRFYVVPLVSLRSREMTRFFQEISAEYDVRLKTEHGEFVLEFKKRRERYTLNIILFILTFLSVTFTGSMFYGNFDLKTGLQFALAVMFVLGSHELAHYLTSRRWGMKTSLPYFIPFPTIIGTLGAVIKQRGLIKNRKALLEIGISGPIAGVLASVIVSYFGFKMRVPEMPAEGQVIVLGEPVLFRLIAEYAGYQGYFIHPVAFAGWVGMFITALNLIPVGQLDGGHVMRAIAGTKSELVSRIFPFILISIGFIYRESGVWLFWGLITMFFSMQRHPDPEDDSKLPMRYVVAGITTFLIGLLCFTPTPFRFSKGL